MIVIVIIRVKNFLFEKDLGMIDSSFEVIRDVDYYRHLGLNKLKVIDKMA